MPPTPTPFDATQRSRAFILRVVRVVFFILIITVAFLLILQQPSGEDRRASEALAINYWVPLSIAISFFGVVLAIDVLTPNKRIAAISGVFLGALTGILLSFAISMVIDLALKSWIEQRELDALRPVIRAVDIMLGVALCYLCISTVLQTQDQFRLVIPYVEFSKQLRGIRPNILDTSVLIDARIVDVAATGILQSPFVIPGFVIAELQTLADSSEKLKRARGRRGLEVISRLQRQGTLDLSIDDSPVIARAVDQALIELAERLGAKIVTTDLALQRVAQIRGLTTLNIHDIAAAFKPSLLPGEQIIIRLVKPGEQPGQGVGYLDDGTMVVAEGGSPHINAGETPLLVTSSMQTTAGRLVFAKVLATEDETFSPVADSTSVERRAHAASTETQGTDPPASDATASESTAADANHQSTEPIAFEAPAPHAQQPLPPRTGPFPPKSATRRPNPSASPRNPRR